MKKPAPRLRRKLLALVLAILLPALAAGSLTLYIAYQGERQNTERYLAETTRALSLAVDRQLGQAEATLFALAASPYLAAGDFASFDAQARETLRLPESWVLLEDSARQVVNTLLPPGAALPSHDGRHWKLQSVGQASVSNLFTGTVAGQPAVATDMLVDREGKRYSLGVITRYQAFNRILADQALPPNWIGSILDRNGVVIARNRDADRFVGISGTSETLRWIRDGRSPSTITQTRSLDGVETVVAYNRSPLSGWTLLVAVPLTEVTRTALQSAWLLIGTGGLLLTLGALLAALAARSIARPIEALAAEAASLGRGQAVAAARTGFREADAVAEAMRNAGISLRSREEELKRLNAALAARAAASEGERDRLFDLSNDLFAVAGFDGYLKTINPAWERVLGYDRKHLLATPLLAFVHPDDHADAGELIERLRRGAVVQRFEDRVIRADGQSVWVSWAAVPEGDRFYAVGRDITAAKEQEIALMEANARLQQEIAERERAEASLVQAQKIEALGQLTGGIAHDFNNLLTVIMGNLDLLTRASEERRARLIENALHAVEQGRRLTSQLLAFGRRQSLKPEVVDLNGLIVDMQDMLAQSLRGDIRVEHDLAGDLWPVRVDAAQLRVALINLAANARDAMPKGGVFLVRTRNTIMGPKDDRKGVVIEVSDTGTGMSQEVLARAFDPFFTTKDVGKGTGLGLAQVYGFVRQSEGSVDLRSEADRGTTVTLYLPKADSPAFGPRQTNLPSTAVRPARILLVEDNHEVADLAAALLAEQGHTVVRAGNASEALHTLGKDSGFDLVFSDVVMPGQTNGLDLARTIRSRWPSLPVVLATGYSEATGSPNEEGFPLLRKPYRPEDLHEHINHALAGVSLRPSRAKGNIVPLVRER